MNKLTQLRLLKEMVISKQDALHYITTHAAMHHPVHGPIAFQPHEYQMEYLNALISGEHVILKAARNTGTTITTMMYIFYYAMFNSDRTIFLTSHTLDQAFDNLQRIRYAWENLHKIMRGGMELTTNNKREMRFSNGTRIIAAAANGNTGRGTSIDLLHIDNFELIRTQVQEELIYSIMPCLNCYSKGSQAIITSTSPGQGSTMFNDMYYDAVARKDTNIETKVKSYSGRNFIPVKMVDQYVVPAVKKNPNQSIFNIPDIKT